MFTKLRWALLPLAFAATPGLAQGAAAADRAGPYAVVRGGALIDSDLRFRDTSLAAPATVGRNVDGKVGFAGEAGVGYAFDDGFRVEGTANYLVNRVRPSLDARTAVDAGGITRTTALMVSGYYDFIRDGAFTPYIGVGVGAANVDARIARVAGLAAGGSSIRDRDWAFAYQGTVGIAYRVTPSITLDLSGRYLGTTRLDLDGSTGAFVGTRPAGSLASIGRRYQARSGNVSTMVGVRFGF